VAVQTLTALGKNDGVTAVSLLDRKAPGCVAAFLSGLGAVLDRGLNVNLKVSARFSEPSNFSV
jgi:hypothetical protein